jgi:hypothetical protein
MAPESMRERIIVDHKKPRGEVCANFLEEEKKVNVDEMQFVAEIVNPRLRLESQRKPRSTTNGDSDDDVSDEN